jgi:hypothetical protein
MTEEEEVNRQLGEVLYWIRVSERQIANFVDSLLTVAESTAGDFMPALADGHFLLISAAQAERTAKKAGYPMDNRISIALRSLRDVHEHWEEQKDSFASNKLSKTRSGKIFAEAYPGELPWRYAMDATGTWISTLRLEDLWQELLVIEAKIGPLVEHQQVPYSDDTSRPFPKRNSRVLGFVVVTQDIIIDFRG